MRPPGQWIRNTPTRDYRGVFGRVLFQPTTSLCESLRILSLDVRLIRETQVVGVSADRSPKRNKDIVRRFQETLFRVRKSGRMENRFQNRLVLALQGIREELHGKKIRPRRFMIYPGLCVGQDASPTLVAPLQHEAYTGGPRKNLVTPHPTRISSRIVTSGD
jgi:hypothetical protein